MVTFSGIVLIAAGVVVGLLVVVEAIARLGGGRFIATVILGDDGRTSTSKTFIFLWTLLVGWGLVALLIAGEIVPVHGCVPAHFAASACRDDAVGRLQQGWARFLHAGLAGSYLILLGLPAAAGVAAKQITRTQVTGAGFKKPRRAPDRSRPLMNRLRDVKALVARLAEIFSADDGTTDLGDFQYLIFNLVTAAYFVVRFLRPDPDGLPAIPGTLLGLTSVSAGLYVAKKAVTNTQPTVSGVFPLPLHDGQRFTVIGGGLTGDSETSAEPQITIDGMVAEFLHAQDGNLIVKAPPSVGPGGTPIVRQLRVLNPYGGITADFPVQCL